MLAVYVGIAINADLITEFSAEKLIHRYAVRLADDIVVLEQGIRFAGSKEECLQREILEQNFEVRRCDCGQDIFFK